jgi:hypothetical protein
MPSENSEATRLALNSMRVLIHFRAKQHFVSRYPKVLFFCILKPTGFICIKDSKEIAIPFSHLDHQVISK